MSTTAATAAPTLGTPAAAAASVEADADTTLVHASSQVCDLTSASFIRLLIEAFRHGNDAAVRDGFAKALALNGDVNPVETDAADNLDLAADAIVDLYMNTLEFCAGQSYSHLQTQQLLLLLVDCVDMIAAQPVQEVAASAPPAQQPQQHPLNNVLYHFSRKVAKMCVPTVMLVDERSVVTETREEEHVDPAALAAYEARLAKAKKGQEKSVEPPPKMKVIVTEDKETYTRKEITIGPSFAPHDMRAIVDFFDVTVFQHWQLVRLVVTQPRTVETTIQDVFLEDVPTFLPPLHAAMTLEDFTMMEQRAAVETAWAEGRATMMAEEAAERQELLNVEEESSSVVRARDAAARHADLSAALSPNEYSKTVAVLSSAVGAATNKKLTTASLLKRIERVEAAALNSIGAKNEPAAAPPSTAQSPSAAKRK